MYTSISISISRIYIYIYLSIYLPIYIYRMLIHFPCKSSDCWGSNETSIKRIVGGHSQGGWCQELGGAIGASVL